MFNAADYLPRVLDGLKRSTFRDFELLVVDDGSTDGSRELAASLGVPTLWSGGRRGAGPARNVGVQAAKAPILVFLDADVVMHEDALTRIAAAFETDPGLAAVMGSYDDTPAAPGLVSRFRNLIHAHFHHHAASEASTFWTGLGAVRRSVFEAVGGFTPGEILEDVEFGVRLRAAGHSIRLDPTIQGTHLKDWSLVSMVQTDLFKRGVPWIEMALQRDGLRDDLNTTLSQRVSVAAIGVLLLAVAGGVLTQGLAFAAPMTGLAVTLCLPLFSPGDRKAMRPVVLVGTLASAGGAALALLAAGQAPAAIAVGLAGLLTAAIPIRFEARPQGAEWAVASAVLLALVLSLAATPVSPLMALGAGAWAAQLWLNRGLFGLLGRRLGPLGLLGGVPLLLIYHLCCGLSVIIGTAKHVAKGRRARTAPAPAHGA